MVKLSNDQLLASGSVKNVHGHYTHLLRKERLLPGNATL